TASSGAVLQATSTRILVSAVQAPRMNAICERLAGTLRREVPGRTLILGEAHLRAVLHGVPTALQHRQAAPGHRTACPRPGSCHHPLRPDRPRHHADPPKTRPGQPDQRIYARSLIHREPPGHRTESYFRAAQGRMAQPRPRPAVRRTFCRSSGTAHYRKKGMTNHALPPTPAPVPQRDENMLSSTPGQTPTDPRRYRAVKG